MPENFVFVVFSQQNPQKRATTCQIRWRKNWSKDIFDLLGQHILLLWELSKKTDFLDRSKNARPNSLHEAKWASWTQTPKNFQIHKTTWLYSSLRKTGFCSPILTTSQDWISIPFLRALLLVTLTMFMNLDLRA